MDAYCAIAPASSSAAYAAPQEPSLSLACHQRKPQPCGPSGKIFLLCLLYLTQEHSKRLPAMQEKDDSEDEEAEEEQKQDDEEEAEEDNGKAKKKEKKDQEGNPALHWLFRKIAYIARKPGNDERVRHT